MKRNAGADSLSPMPAVQRQGVRGAEPWAAHSRLRAPPADAQTPWGIVGCESGAVLALNGKGETVRRAKLNARAATIDVLPTPQGLAIVLVSDKGEVKAFAMGR